MENIIVQVVTLVVTVATVSWGIIKFFLAKLDKLDEKIQAEKEDIANKLKDLDDRYTRREEFNRTVERLDSAVEKVFERINETGVQINQRLDALLMSLGKVMGPNGKGRG